MEAKIKTKSGKGVHPGYRPTSFSIKDPPMARKRLASCPMEQVKNAINLDHSWVEWNHGLWGDDQIACGKWILLARIPDPDLLSAEWRDKIMEWVRKTL